MSYSHGSRVNWVGLYEISPRKPMFVLHQVEQRVTHLLLVYPNDGVSHGENLHHVRCDPDVQISLHLVTFKQRK